ncbi:zinc-dependent alcohol dehydrogenase family protein [Lysinibacillus parviboronicapiens]|uniref:zinc-dependent alcohol dehydrogenase family protein n=1 Tax=Lysinibacillus parviboronicapiens TaxID=436516 RepID=UPI000D3A084A|nr:zinc-dependent alcohol dehydrogenase family protein [Lysinibacillus parviboronicapiens]
MKAKCIKIYEFGSPKNVLKFENKTIKPPQNHEILVRMLARPINPSDLIPIWGKYAHRIALPNTPGYEGVGVVEAVGPLVSQNLLGQRVLPLRGEGTWQELVQTRAEFAVPIPDSMDDFTAAQMYINPMTAWVICTEVLKLTPKDVLLVNACGSAIGHIFAQLAKIIGFHLIAVTRNPKHTRDLLQLGASYVIDTSTVNLCETVMEITNGQGADAAIDSIGGSAGNDLAFCVRPSGNFLTIGLLSGVQVNWGNIVNDAHVRANMFHLRHWNNQVSTVKWQETFQQLITLVEEQKLMMLEMDAQYDLLNIHKAIDVLESPKKTKGKIFLTSY